MLNKKVAIGIKALNEQNRIGECIEYALLAVSNYNGEVILADSGSTDNTVIIGKKYPVKIVQLSQSSDRSCGAGAQLAYQASAAEYFYILDADMLLKANFLKEAVEFLDANQEYAAVGGQLQEKNTEGESYRILAENVRNGKNWKPGDVSSVDGGGLYRSAAINQLGYFADRNLHSFEEADLGARLRAAGWKLHRVSTHSVEHFGHAIGGYKLLYKRMKSKYLWGSGEIFRGSLNRRHFRHVFLSISHIPLSIIVMLWWIFLIFVIAGPFEAAWKIASFSLSIIAPIFFLSLRRRSFELGIYSFVAWNFSALGFIIGALRGRKDPISPLQSITL